VSRITRKELKTDKFALEVEHTVDFFEVHRDKIIRYSAIGAVVVLAIVAFLWYSRSQHAAREEALNQALQAVNAPVGDQNTPGAFPTEEARQQEATKRLTDIATRYGGSEQGDIAVFYLASQLADQGKLSEAEKRFKEVADSGKANYASLAKLSLSQIYFSDGRNAEGEKVLRSLIDNPTAFVSKDQATIALARAIAPTKPAEARKLLEPLRTVPGQVGQVAITMYGEIPAQ
jgi:predicted negative regulator of RcsB-dependent stress response